VVGSIEYISCVMAVVGYPLPKKENV